jgi:hypothetical protein
MADWNSCQGVETILAPDSGKVLGEVLSRDQAGFFSLILEFADCAAAHAEAPRESILASIGSSGPRGERRPCCRISLPGH